MLSYTTGQGKIYYKCFQMTLKKYEIIAFKIFMFIDAIFLLLKLCSKKKRILIIIPTIQHCSEGSGNTIQEKNMGFKCLEKETRTLGCFILQMVRQYVFDI